MANMSKKKLKLEQIEEPKLYFAIRIRGSPGMSKKLDDTLKMLRMHKVNHGVLLWGTKSVVGMLKKVKDFIAFGEIDEKTLVRLLRVRGRAEGNKHLTDDYIKNLTDYKTIKEFAKDLHSGKIKYNTDHLYKVKPVFRLHPPIKGHRGSIKKAFNEGGTLGYVGNYINELIYRMV
ncbi:MAG: 50S ribosomal protein L30 [Promethearchaeati archaeon]